MSLLARGLRTQPAGVARFSTSACVHAKARRVPYHTLGGGLVVAGGGMYMLSPERARAFSVHSPAESQVKGSSTLLRPASPSAPRRQTVTLVFLTSEGTSPGLVQSVMSNLGPSGSGRDKWYSWIGYFREAGYDCLQMNVALPDAASDNVTGKLSEELHEQIKLSNLQRLPVLFVHHGSKSSPDDTAEVVSSYIEPAGSSGGGVLSNIFGGGGMFGSKPAISGLIVVSDLDSATAQAKFAKHPKLNTLIVANGAADAPQKGKVHTLDSNGKSHEQTVKDIERWLIRQGYEG